MAGLRGEDPQSLQRWVPPFPIGGLQLTVDQSMSLSTVWACIDIIAKSIASCRWHIYEPVPGTNRRRLLDSDWKTWMLNTRPNDDMTAIGFREALLFQAIPFGNAYAEIVRDAGGRVTQLWPLLTDRMTPRRNPQTWALEYHYVQPDGSIAIMPARRVFHLRGPGLWGLMGDNVIARAAKTLAVAAAQERFSASFFGQGAQPIGALEFPGKLDDKTHARLKEDWAQKYKGPDNAHKPLILEAGMRFSPISIDPQKSQLTEGKKFSVEEICRWFGVPPHKVQHLEHATFSNIEHSSIEFVRDSLRPWERRLCQEADAKLFDQTRGPWKVTEIDLRPLTQGDAVSRAQAQASWRQNGIMTANEIRAQEGLDDCGDDGDVLLVQSNLTTTERLLAGPGPELGNLDPSVTEDGEDEDEGGDELAETDPTVPQSPDAVRTAQRQALQSAIMSALDRYGRRLHNRREALATSPDRDVRLTKFRTEQADVLAAELKFFSSFAVAVVGRELDALDMSIAAAMYERGEDIAAFVHQLPHTTQRTA